MCEGQSADPDPQLPGPMLTGRLLHCGGSGQGRWLTLLCWARPAEVSSMRDCTGGLGASSLLRL